MIKNSDIIAPLFKEQMPKDWLLKKLEDACILLRDGTHLPPKRSDEGPLLLSVRNLIDGYLLETSDDTRVSWDFYYRMHRYWKPEVEDVLLAVVGATIGKTAQVPSNFPVFTLQRSVAILRGSPSKVINSYLRFFLDSDLFTRQMWKRANQTAQPGIYLNELGKIKISLPPLPEQRAIANALSLMDTAINLNNQLIAQKELRKKWLMQNLLTGKLRLKGFNGEWKEYFINKLFEKVYRYIKWDEKTTYNLVSIKRRYGGLFFRGDLLGENISVKKLKSIQEGDFLISKRQVSHGAWVVVTKEFNGGKVSDEYDCLKISNNKILNADFWKWYCQQRIMTHYAYLDSIGVHIEKLIFHYSLFKKRKVRIPDTIEEQIAIAQVLQAADKEIVLLKAKTDKLREQKKGMMQVLLTGEKRLNQDALD